MRIIPVMDLLNLQTVHAVKGMRQYYKPVHSVLCDSPDPIAIAGAFLGKLGLRELYIADLDAIQDISGTDNRPVIEQLARSFDLEIMLDAGVSDVGSAIRWIDTGIRKLVIGSETLVSMEALKAISEEVGADRIVFSLDCTNGKILSRCAKLQGATPLVALEQVEALGLRETILLELDRVGSGAGAHLSMVSEIRRAFPGVSLILGGGISSAAEIAGLQSMGLEGVLVATALHNGTIDSEQLSGMNR